MKNKKILLVAFINTHLNELAKIAKYLKNSKQKFDPVILYIDDYMKMDYRYYDKISKDKIKLINILGQNIHLSKPLATPPIPRQRQFVLWCKKQLIIKWLYEKIIIKVYYFFQNFGNFIKNSLFFRSYAYYQELKNKTKEVNEIFTKIKPDLLILNEENIFYLTNVFTKTAKDCTTASIIIPYAICESDGFAKTLYNHNEVKGVFKIIAYFLPKWTQKYKKRLLFLLPLYKIFIMSLFKIAPPNPWKINDGFFDAIAVESKFMKKYYPNNSSANKLILTGSIADDILYKNLKQQKSDFYEKYNLKHKPIILCSLPSQPDGGLNYEFSSYDEIIEFMVKSLVSVKSYNVIFNCHPHIGSDKICKFEKMGAKVIRQDLAELIPYSDLFIASISSTIRWAISVGKPVINYDVYRFRYHDYDSAKGVVTIEKKEDFERVLKKITTDKKYYQDLKEKQEKCASNWGILDGKSGERIINLIVELINHAK